MTDPMSTITINLDDSDNNTVVDASQLIQKNTFERLKGSITNDLSRAHQKQNSQKDAPYGSGLVYFIDGTRGAGKSTFLQSIYPALETDIDTHQLRNLAYIDPSRIEDGEVVLMGILKALNSQMATHFAKTSSLESERFNTEFRNEFKQLAGGLSLFADNSDQFKDLDEELFLEWGLERAANSTGLRKHLHALLEISCKALKCDALVIAFDDADTNAQHARNTLECIRKYLDTPRLVLLVTGDFELYSLMVRDHFYHNLGGAKHDQSQERQAQRNKMIDHLEDQYLLKLFPIQRRFQLRPLWNILAANKYAYFLSHSAWDQNRAIPAVIDELIGRGLRIKTSRDLELYQEFLLKQPLRSILQVISQCAPQLEESDNAGKLSKEWGSELSNDLSESLRALALGSLYKFGVDVDAIAANELPELTKAVFDLSIRDGDFDTAAYLRPQPSNLDLKNSFAALSADVARLCAHKPSALINYMLAGPGSVALYDEVLRRKGDEQKDIRRQFEQYMGIGRKEDALNWARHGVAILAAPYLGNKSAMIYSGIVGLNKQKPTNAPKAELTQHRVALNTLDSFESLPAFALSLVDVSGTSARTYASIYNILGLMARLLALKPDNDTYPVSSILSIPFPPLTVSPPQWEGGLLDDEDEGDALERSCRKRKKRVLRLLNQQHSSG